MSVSTPKITLYRGWLEPGRHVWSPFVIKLEARLRFAGVPYETKAGSVRTAPKGKIPYVEVSQSTVEGGDNETAMTTQLGDSTLIIKSLVEWGVLPDVNDGLDRGKRATDLAIRALLEEKLYFYHTRERWTQNYYSMRDHVLSALPYPLRIVVGNLIYRNIIKTLHGQGTGRYTDDEIRMFRKEIWETVNDLLVSARAGDRAGDRRRPFWILGGDTPRESDATLFGFVVSVLVCTA
ncbi:glutathione s-transferase [Aspergillus sclerotialis]|uniref:Glutathione s-transferase n=1 Tax=Aspergillus sclerotialis TaxID=2070753 RepID=A0A3A2ZTH6_9EURO|nr:glutathione s-transferase [Aspergillus sclerotialis]